MIQLTPEVAVLHLLMAKGLGRRTFNRLIESTSTEGMPLADVPCLSKSELTGVLGLRPAVADAVRADSSMAYSLADDLHSKGVRLLLRGQPEYPRRLSTLLRDDAPPVLFSTGKASLLQTDGAAVCGSRKCSQRGLKITEHIAEQLSIAGINVVSGYAAGVDLAAHVGSLRAEGTTTVVLAEGILSFRPKYEVEELMNTANMVTISEFYPNARWAARNAMQRNATVCALSKSVVLIESGTDGGTYEGGEKARALGIPLFVVDFADPPESAKGNRLFLERGAVPIRSNGSGLANTDGLVEAIRTAVEPRPVAVERGIFDSVRPESEPS